MPIWWLYIDNNAKITFLSENASVLRDLARTCVPMNFYKWQAYIGAPKGEDCRSDSLIFTKMSRSGSRSDISEWVGGEKVAASLLWRHNGRDGVSDHQPHKCLLNRLFRRRSKKTSKLRVTGLRAGNSPVTGEFPTKMASSAENVSIWWRHHVVFHTNDAPVHWRIHISILAPEAGISSMDK